MNISEFLQKSKTGVFFEALVRNPVFYPPGQPPKHELSLRGTFVFEGKVIGHEEVPYESPEDITLFFQRASRNIKDRFSLRVRALREKEHRRTQRRAHLDRLCDEMNALEVNIGRGPR
jgi:hypothetical protein